MLLMTLTLTGIVHTLSRGLAKEIIMVWLWRWCWLICCPHCDVLLYILHNAIKVRPLESARGFQTYAVHIRSHISPAFAVSAIWLLATMYASVECSQRAESLTTDTCTCAMAIINIWVRCHHWLWQMAELHEVWLLQCRCINLSYNLSDISTYVVTPMIISTRA